MSEYKQRLIIWN